MEHFNPLFFLMGVAIAMVLWASGEWLWDKFKPASKVKLNDVTPAPLLRGSKSVGEEK